MPNPHISCSGVSLGWTTNRKLRTLKTHLGMQKIEQLKFYNHEPLKSLEKKVLVQMLTNVTAGHFLYWHEERKGKESSYMGGTFFFFLKVKLCTFRHLLCLHLAFPTPTCKLPPVWHQLGQECWMRVIFILRFTIQGSLELYKVDQRLGDPQKPSTLPLLYTRGAWSGLSLHPVTRLVLQQTCSDQTNGPCD